MSKADKKLRQLHRREVRKNMEQHKQVIDTRLEEYLSELDQLLKPNPWFIPAFVWISLQKLFLNI